MRKFKSLKKGSSVHMLKRATWGGFGYSLSTVSDVKFINKDVMTIEFTDGNSYNVISDYSKMDLGNVKLFTDGRDAKRVFLEGCE